jgi:hypothetical protein
MGFEVAPTTSWLNFSKMLDYYHQKELGKNLKPNNLKYLRSIVPYTSAPSPFHFVHFKERERGGGQAGVG